MEEIDVYNNIIEKMKNKITKKAFFIDFDEEYVIIPAIDGLKKPGLREIQLAIEHYCIRNKHSFEYLSMDDPIVFMIDGKETYRAEAMLVHNRFMNGYQVKCTEV